MSGIFGETLTFQQESGGEVRLVVFGDEKYARYETVDGYTAVYDQQGGWYCYADLREGRFVSTGVPVTGPPPAGLARHLHEAPGTRRDELLTFDRALLPPSAPASRAERLLTFGPSGGLLPGRRLSEGNVRGLTILITFPGEQTTVTRADVEGLLNGDNFSENGNFSSVNGYFRLVSTNRLNFTNTVIGPFQMSRPKLAYANQDGLLVPEAFQLALDAGVDLTQFDSLGQGIVDALCILYADRTEYKGDLWPHNWVFRRQAGGVRTDLYIVSSMGRRPADLSIGTFCHEAGHLLCRFPDLYDYGDIEREGDPIKSAVVLQIKDGAFQWVTNAQP